ncbi:MAG: type I restriction enzyme endonuclease domain-containing protein, partial [Flavobacteriaceae bacterium]
MNDLRHLPYIFVSHASKRFPDDFMFQLTSEELANWRSQSVMSKAFYTAVANNDSAKQLMQKNKLLELAVILTERVKQNASIDWTIKDSVRAKLKGIIKRTLRQYGYPPDMQKL